MVAGDPTRGWGVVRQEGPGGNLWTGRTPGETGRTRVDPRRWDGQVTGPGQLLLRRSPDSYSTFLTLPCFGWNNLGRPTTTLTRSGSPYITGPPPQP